MVILLDDLHWAAKPTLLMLRHLVRATQDAPVLMVGTYRDTDLDRRHPLAEVLADLRRDKDVERIALHGLDEGEVTAFVEAAADQPSGPEIAEVAREVYAETGGQSLLRWAGAAPSRGVRRGVAARRPVGENLRREPARHSRGCVR